MVKSIWFDRRTHRKEHQNSYWLSMKCVLASDQSSVRSWLVQPIKELSSAAGRCAGWGCALIRQLANYGLWHCRTQWPSILQWKPNRHPRVECVVCFRMTRGSSSAVFRVNTSPRCIDSSKNITRYHRCHHRRQSLTLCSDTPGNPGNLLDICHVCWKLSYSV